MKLENACRDQAEKGVKLKDLEQRLLDVSCGTKGGTSAGQKQQQQPTLRDTPPLAVPTSAQCIIPSLPPPVMTMQCKEDDRLEGVGEEVVSSTSSVVDDRRRAQDLRAPAMRRRLFLQGETAESPGG
eukprot:2827746-Rhodomonas_salina.1